MWETSREWDFDESDIRHQFGPLPRTELADPDPNTPAEIVLCLSGGGYRAVAFHLGALRRLRELGLFQCITEVRSVSGGSIVAAHLNIVLAKSGALPSGETEWEEVVAKPLRTLLSKDSRTLPIAATILVNALWKEPRLRLVERRFMRYLPGLAATLSRELPVRFTFLASDLVSGGLIELPLPQEATGAWTLARVAATSAAFPPFFGPRNARVGDQPLRLVDGGVYGNTGVSERVLARSRVVLVSDASYPLGVLRMSRRPRLWFLRSLRVAMSRGDAALRTHLWMRDATNHRFESWRIDQTTHVPELDPPAFEYPPDVVARVSTVRTDMDPFSAGEIGVLENHGYMRAASALAWLLTRLADDHADQRLVDVETLRKIVEQHERPVVRPPHAALLNPTRALHELHSSDVRIRSLRRIARAVGRPRLRA